MGLAAKPAVLRVLKEHPLIFTAESILAIQAGLKTQTRRVMRPQPPRGARHDAVRSEGGVPWAFGFIWGKPGNPTMTDCICRHGRVGDRLWVRERWCSYIQRTDAEEALIGKARDAFYASPSLEGIQTFALATAETKRSGPEKFMYAADFGTWADHPDSDLHWTSPRFMPKRAARLWLEVEHVRVQRVQEITPGDVDCEGYKGMRVFRKRSETQEEADGRERLRWFAKTWNKINGKRDGCDWASNPFVWVIGFKLARPAMEEA